MGKLHLYIFLIVSHEVNQNLMLLPVRARGISVIISLVPISLKI